MHADEIATDLSLVRRLLAAQFPEWAGLPIVPVPSAGTSNAIYRLGEDMAVRLPRRPFAAAQVEKEQRWLPRLAPHVPLAIPVPLAAGKPSEGYPEPWSVYRWLEGETATVHLGDVRQAARDLGRFVAALQRIDAAEGPPPGEHNGLRGAPLAAHDPDARGSIAALRDSVDTDAATRAWDAALRVPEWRGPQVWFHGDLIAANLLVRDGRLSAAIDFGCSGVGDPAYDVMAAWTFVSAEARPLFRAEVQADDATWARGRGLALAWGLTALSYYRTIHPVMSALARRAISEVLADGPRTT